MVKAKSITRTSSAEPAGDATERPQEESVAATPVATVGRGQAYIPGLTAVLLIIAALTGLLLHLLHLCSRDPNFDEHILLQYTWLVSQGAMPRVDFLCPYPTAGFLLFATLLRHLNQEPGLFLALRIFSLVPLALFVLLVGELARHQKRDRWLAMTLAIVFVASGQFPTLWEIRFDLGTWTLAIAALALLLRSPGTPVVALASAVAFFSVLVSPKHAFFLAGVAVGFAIDRWREGLKPFVHAVLAALVGAATTAIALTCFNPDILPDSLHLAILNFKTQKLSDYPVTLFESLFTQLLTHPIISSILWFAPVLFLSSLRTLPRRTALLNSGGLMGLLLTLASLPCGYPQYTSLIWVLAMVFSPWLTPSTERIHLRILLAGGLAVLSLFYMARELPAWSAKPLLTQLRLQDDLAVICPPGDTAVAAPFTHAWFRRNPGYVFIDNTTSYRHGVRKARQRYFTSEYFYEQLVKAKPAYVCGFNMADNAPKEYQDATIRFLIAQGTNYVAGSIPYVGHELLKDGRMPVFIRQDILHRANPRVEHATQAR